MDTNEIQASLTAASEYLVRLKELQSELNFAEQQVLTSAKETEVNINTVFEELCRALVLSLNTRRDHLLKKTKEIKDNGIQPLLQCRQVISKKIENTTKFIDLGQDLLNCKSANNNSITEFSDKSSLLGSLPEVPSLKQVPYLSFQYELANKTDFLSVPKDFGSVVHIAPVQISSIKEQPGAILVEWNLLDNDDHNLEVQQYRLQKSFGNIKTEKYVQENFRDCYTGLDTQYLEKDLNIDQDYTFRICCRYDGQAEWGPWSLPEIGKTKLKFFCWDDSNHFSLTNENKIAIPLNNLPCTLFSGPSLFDSGYSVEFSFLECDNDLNGTFVGLFTSNKIPNGNVVNTESVCVEANGNIYGSGVKKSTQLPSVCQGTKICFTCDMKVENKIRINIDACGKRVTYDWPIESDEIYFGAKFNSSKWKIMIS